MRRLVRRLNQRSGRGNWMCDDRQPDESEKTACVVNASVRTIAPEQLRKLLADHRNSLQKRCFELRQSAMRMEKDIASIDALLTELTIS